MVYRFCFSFFSVLRLFFTISKEEKKSSRFRIVCVSDALIQNIIYEYMDSITCVKFKMMCVWPSLLLQSCDGHEMLANVQKYDQLHDGHGEAHFTYFQLTWTSFKDGS